MVRKEIGQNFLIDKRVAEREVEYADLKKDDVVLEVGPGKGILTELIAKKVKEIVAIEIDSQLVEELKAFLPDNVIVINTDVLKIDFKTLPVFNKIVANLPFQISSPITFKFLEYPFSVAILIYQKDFAKRMVAYPGIHDYSRLSVGVYYKAFCRILETVPSRCFYPVPKVDSCIVELRLREKPPFSVLNEQFFFNVTKNLFNHRRKKIKNTLEEIYDEVENISYLDNRVEELTPEQIGELSNQLYTLYHS